MKLNFFIGYDSKEDIAYRVCKYSLLKRTNAEVNVVSLKIDELIKRINNKLPKEIILATNPTLEGEATSMYLSNFIKDNYNNIIDLTSLYSF